MVKARLLRGMMAGGLLLTFAAGLVFSSQSRQATAVANGPAAMAQAGGAGGKGGIDPDSPVDGISAPIVETHGKAYDHKIDVRNLPQNGPDASEKKLRPEAENPSGNKEAATGPFNDPVAQNFAPTGGAAIAPSLSTDGLGFATYGTGWPPDTHGDVGPNHYIQGVNGSVGIFDKATGTRLAAYTLNNFFPAGTACDNNNQGDPIILFDHYSQRFIVTNFNWASTRGPYYECIAVAKTADPVSGGWWIYALQVNASQMGDYPRLGVWHDGIYMTANMFKSGRTYSGVKVWALNRDDLTTGATLRTVAFTLGTSYFSLFPSHARVNNPAAGTPNFLLSNYGLTNGLRMWKFTTNWTTPSASSLTGPTTIAVATFAKPGGASVPQLGSTEKLDTLGDRLMNKVTYSNVGGNEALWVSHAVVNGTSTGVRWYEIRNPNGTASVYQQGTYAPDSSYRWMSDIAVDKNGNAAIAYNISSSSMYPGIRYAMRSAGDALGTMGAESVLVNGGGSQNGGYNRWGDYASLSIDPVDGCTAWFTGEYYKTTGSAWSTFIGSFKLPGCP